MSQKTDKFTIDKIGTFEFYTEVPHTLKFLNRRKRLSEVLGIRQLLELEQMVREGMQSEADDLSKKMGLSALDELGRADSVIQMRDHIFSFPEGKSLEELTQDEFLSVEKEFQQKLKFFREAPAEDSPSTEPKKR